MDQGMQPPQGPPPQQPPGPYPYGHPPHGQGPAYPPPYPPPPRKSSVGVIVAIVLTVVLLGGVAVIGVMAAIAIPSFLAMQLRAKRSEAPTNLDGIRTAEKAYHAEWDVFTNCDWTFPGTPGRDPRPFDGGGITAFQNLGWTAYGNVRCRYRVINATSSGDWDGDDFEAYAECDIDGDGNYAVYTATSQSRPTMVTSNNVY